MRDKLNKNIVKAKDDARLKAMIPHMRKFMECCQEIFTHNIIVLHYKIYDASSIYICFMISVKSS